MNLEGAGDDNLMVSLGKKIGWRGVWRRRGGGGEVGGVGGA